MEGFGPRPGQSQCDLNTGRTARFQHRQDSYGTCLSRRLTSRAHPTTWLSCKTLSARSSTLVARRTQGLCRGLFGRRANGVPIFMPASGTRRSDRTRRRFAGRSPALYGGRGRPRPDHLCTQPRSSGHHLNGTADPVNPFAGGGAPYWGYGALAVSERWADINDCRCFPGSRRNHAGDQRQ